MTLSTDRPIPPEHDFAFCVDFKRGAGSASRIFSAIHDFVLTCEEFDRHLAGSVDSRIKPIILLEDIEAGSLKAYFRYVLESLDDEDLRSLNFKNQLGKLLVKAKHLTIEWMDKKDGAKNLDSLRKEIHQIAKEEIPEIERVAIPIEFAEEEIPEIERVATPIGFDKEKGTTSVIETEKDAAHLQPTGFYIPAPPLLKPRVFVTAIQGFQKVKSHLNKEDQAYMTDSNGVRYDMDLSVTLSGQELQLLLVSDTRVVPPAWMTLVIRKPDYLGKSRWEVRHNGRNIAVKIEDRVWLKRFQDREVRIQPGDALVCWVRVEEGYDIDGNLVTEKFYVQRVNEVLEKTDLT